MVRRWIVVAALAAATGSSFVPQAHATWLAELRGGAVEPIQGDLRDYLDLGVGPAFGVTLGWEASDSLALDLRVDGMWMWGTPSAHGIGHYGGWFTTDAAMSTYAITIGPTFRSEMSSVELVLGVHPGLYLSQFEAEDDYLDLAPIRVLASKDFDSGTSIDFGFNADLGARVPVTESFLVGAELAYHFAFVRDLADDSFGALIGSLSVAWRG